MPSSVGIATTGTDRRCEGPVVRGLLRGGSVTYCDLLLDCGRSGDWPASAGMVPVSGSKARGGSGDRCWVSKTPIEAEAWRKDMACACAGAVGRGWLC